LLQTSGRTTSTNHLSSNLDRNMLLEFRRRRTRRETTSFQYIILGSVSTN
jgi:hypothetical protein